MANSDDSKGTLAALTQVSIVITNFNGGQDLLDTIDSCKQSGDIGVEIIIADDGSTDNSADEAVAAHPDVRVVSLGENTKLLNRVRNAGIKAASSDLVMLMDNDIMLAPGCITRLLEVLRSDDSIACTSPRLIVERDGQRKIYWDGGELHYLGASICANRNADVNTPTRPPQRNIGCGILLIDRKKLDAIGYFDESYWLGWADDGEIYYRFLAAGFECLHVSDTYALHIAKERTTERLGAQLRNRWMFMFKNYQLKVLILSAPTLVLFELMQLVFSVLKGAGMDYVKSALSFLGGIPSFIPARRQFQQLRKRDDVDILTSGPLYIAPSQMKNPLMRFALNSAEQIFSVYWRLIKPLLR